MMNRDRDPLAALRRLRCGSVRCAPAGRCPISRPPASTAARGSLQVRDKRDGGRAHARRDARRRAARRTCRSHGDRERPGRHRAAGGCRRRSRRPGRSGPGRRPCSCGRLRSSACRPTRRSRFRMRSGSRSRTWRSVRCSGPRPRRPATTPSASSGCGGRRRSRATPACRWWRSAASRSIGRADVIAAGAASVAVIGDMFVGGDPGIARASVPPCAGRPAELLKV